MKKVIIYALCSILFIGVGTSCGSKSNTDNSNSTEATEINKDNSERSDATKKYIELAKKTNSQMPMPLPMGIRIDKVEAVSKNKYKYYCTFTKEPVVSSEEFIKTAKLPLAVALREGKGDDLDMFREDKMTVIYTYRKMDGSLFAEIVLTPEDYLK